MSRNVPILSVVAAVVAVLSVLSVATVALAETETTTSPPSPITASATTGTTATTATSAGITSTDTTASIASTSGTSTTGAPTGTTTTAERVVVVPCGQDLDAIINADDPTIGTRFQLEGPCTYTVDTMVELNEGDELAGPEGAFIERGPAFDPEPTAFDPEPTVTILGTQRVSNVIRAKGTVHLEWVKIVGGTGEYSSGRSPVAGSGSGLAMGMASNTSSLYAVHITGSDAAGITNAHGTFDRIELDDTTQDSNFLGFTGSGLKAINEVEVKNSYIHDNQGNGLWCDVFCRDSDDD